MNLRVQNVQILQNKHDVETKSIMPTFSGCLLNCMKRVDPLLSKLFMLVRWNLVAFDLMQH